VFARAYAEPDRELRQLAVRFAGRAAAGTTARRVDKTTSKVVLDALSDPDAAVRAEACQAVAALRLPEAESAAEALLADEIESVRIEAAAAVLALHGP
jgi:hypothetical protein